MTVLALLLALQDPESVRVSLDVKDLPLGKVLAWITKDTGIPIEIDDAAKGELDLEGQLVTLMSKDLSVLDTLKLLLAAHPAVSVKAVDKKKIRIFKP